MTNASLQLAFDAVSDKGVRPANEDRVGIPPRTIPQLWAQDPALASKRGWLFCVADGVGGQAAGEIASDMAVTQVLTSYYNAPPAEAEAALRQAIQQANGAIYAEANRDPRAMGMGSTLVAALILGDQLLVANVGDSRAYLVRNGQARQISRDHTLVAQQLASGTITQEEARSHNLRHMITRSLGAQAEVAPDFFHEQIQAGDSIVLCSDGLSGVVPDTDIARLAAASPPAKAARTLVERARKLKSRDNITAVVIQVQPAGGGAASAPVSPSTLAGVVLTLLIGVALLAAIVSQRGRSPAFAATATPLPSRTVLPTRTAEAVTEWPTSTVAAQPTSTWAPTRTAMPTPTRTATQTATRTQTPAPTQTRTPTLTPIPTNTPLREWIIKAGQRIGKYSTGPYWNSGSGGFEGGTFHWTYAVDGRAGANASTTSVKWDLKIERRGVYQISVWIPGKEASSGKATASAKYKINTGRLGEGDISVEVDQEAAREKPQEWVPLEGPAGVEFTLTAGAKLTLTDNTGEKYADGSSNNRRVLFDAVRVTLLSE